MNTSLLNDSQDQDCSDEEETNQDEEDLLLLPRMGTQTESKGLFSMNKSVYALTFLSAVGGFLFG